MVDSNKTTKLMVYVLSAVLVLGAAGGGAYYYFTQRQAKIVEEKAVTDEIPPVLQLGSAGSSLKGMTFESGFLSFTQDDINNFSANRPLNAEIKNSTGRVKYFFNGSAETTVSEIIKKINPLRAGNQMLFAFYSPGEQEFGTEKCYYIYPKAGVPFDNNFKWTPPDSNTPVCLIQDPETFKIPADRGFALIMKNDFQYYGLKTASESASSFNLKAADDEFGWYMVALPDLKQLNTTDSSALKLTLAPYQNRIVKLYGQTQENEFKEINIDNYQITPEKWSFIWIKLDKKPVPAS